MDVETVFAITVSCALITTLALKWWIAFKKQLNIEFEEHKRVARICEAWEKGFNVVVVATAIVFNRCITRIRN